MSYFFSAKNMAFYSDLLKSDYVEADSWPSDAVEITDEEWSVYSMAPEEGKLLSADVSGKPVWINSPPPTHAESVQAAEGQKQALTAQANAFISSKQWAGKAALGRLKGDELSQYNTWLDYLDALEVVNTASAPDINWPVPPEL